MEQLWNLFRNKFWRYPRPWNQYQGLLMSHTSRLNLLWMHFFMCDCLFISPPCTIFVVDHFLKPLCGCEVVVFDDVWKCPWEAGAPFLLLLFTKVTERFRRRNRSLLGRRFPNPVRFPSSQVGLAPFKTLVSGLHFSPFRSSDGDLTVPSPLRSEDGAGSELVSTIRWGSFSSTAELNFSLNTMIKHYKH